MNDLLLLSMMLEPHTCQPLRSAMVCDNQPDNKLFIGVQAWLLLLKNGSAGCFRIRQRPKLVLDPVQFLLPANNCIELVRCFVDEDSCVGGTAARNFSLADFGVLSSNTASCKRNFFAWIFGSHSTGSRAAAFFKNSVFTYSARSSSGTKGEVAIQVGQSPQGSMISSTLMRRSTAEVRIAMLAPDPCAYMPTLVRSRSPRWAT